MGRDLQKGYFASNHYVKVKYQRTSYPPNVVQTHQDKIEKNTKL